MVWSLAKALHRAGHEVTLIAGKGTAADFARVVELRPGMSVWAQIPDNLDIIHFQNALPPLPAAAYADGISRALTGKRDIPYVVTVHGNIPGFRIRIPFSYRQTMRRDTEAPHMCTTDLTGKTIPVLHPDFGAKGCFFSAKQPGK